MFICITLSELILNIKFGLDLFSHTQTSIMLVWILTNVAISSLGMVVSMYLYRWRYSSAKNKAAGADKKGAAFAANDSAGNLLSSAVEDTEEEPAEAEPAVGRGEETGQTRTSN